MVNLLSSKNIEIQLSLDLIKVEDNDGKESNSASIFKSIRGINHEIKQEMKEEMKSRGLSDDEIRHVFHMDCNLTMVKG